MKKFVLLTILAAAITLSACGKASLEDSGKGQIYYDKELAGVQLVITKTENGTIWYKLNCREEAAQLMTGNSQDAILEQWIGSEWRQLKVKSGFAWTMEAHVVTPESPFEGSLAAAGKYGDLRPGRYRLVKAFSAAGDNYSAKAEFEWPSSEPDVSAATAAPGSEPLTEESETSKRMTSLQEAVGHNPYIGRVTVLSDPVPEVNGEVSVTAVVTESYQGLKEKDEITIRFYESDPTPWKKGFSAILFMQLYEDVIEETSYYWCGQRIYTAGGRLDTDSLRGVDGLTEEQFSEKLRETVGQYSYTGTDMICCPYIHSADPDTIIRESPCILEVRVVSLEDVHTTDREVAVCEPLRFLKGSPTARCRVTVPLNALRKGETYVLLLYKSPGNDEQYDLSSPHSIFPAGSEEAEYIRKQFP